MFIPGMIKRLREAITLLEAHELAEAEHGELLRRAATKVSEVHRSFSSQEGICAKTQRQRKDVADA